MTIYAFLSCTLVLSLLSLQILGKIFSEELIHSSVLRQGLDLHGIIIGMINLFFFATLIVFLTVFLRQI